MPSITGQQIADRAWIKANDPGVRWTAAEALMWINDGQREAVNLLPSAYTLAATPTVQPGTRQTLAGLGLTSGLVPVDVVRNLSVAGVTGRAITLRKREWFDEQRPGWHSEVASEAAHWMFDPRDPKAFYLYPAIAAAAGKLEVIYSASPPDLGSLASVITLEDIYANALQFFVLFSFYSKDTTFAQVGSKAGAYYQQFRQSLGLKSAAVASNAVQAKAVSSIGANA